MNSIGVVGSFKKKARSEDRALYPTSRDELPHEPHDAVNNSAQSFEAVVEPTEHGFGLEPREPLLLDP